MSNWKIVVPMATRNLFINPSFEDSTTGWTTGGTNSIAASADQQKFGAYSCLVTYGNNGTFLSDAITLPTTTTDYYLSAWVYVPTGYDGTVLRLEAASMASSSAVYTTVFTVGTDAFDTWVLLETKLTVSADVTGTLILAETGAPTAAKTMYIDAMQAEETTARTTFCDGDQPGCNWDSTAHGSESTRLATSRLGGVVYDLDDVYGLPVERMIGTGATTIASITTSRPLLPGQQWQRSKARARIFTLVCTFRGSTLADYHAKRQAFMSVVAPDGVGLSDPVTLRYTGAAVEKQIQARYIGGLEMSGPKGFAETVALRFEADDPFFTQIGSNARLLGLTTATFTAVAARIDGVWDNMGPPHASGTYNDIWSIEVSPLTGHVFIAGDFLNFDNQANADYIVEYDPILGTFSPLGSTPLNGVVTDMSFDASGKLYVCGVFTNAGGVGAADWVAKWGGSSWTAVGTPNTGSAAITSGPQAIHYAFDGNLYVGGGFTNFGNDAAADYFAYWDGSTWQDQTGAFNAICYSIHSSPNSGDIYAGGTMTDIGGTTVQYVAKFSPKTGAWSALGAGLAGGKVPSLQYDPRRGTLWAVGEFTNSGGDNDINRIARFRGKRWEKLGTSPNSTSYVGRLGPVKNDIHIVGLFNSAGGQDIPGGLLAWNGTTYIAGDLQLAVFGESSVSGLAVINGKQTLGGTTRLTEDIYYGGSWDGLTGTYPDGTISLNNAGTARTYPIIEIKRVGGTEAKVKRIANATTGEEILLDFNILDGETVTLDTRPGHISMTSDFIPGTLGARGRWGLLAQSILGDFFLLPGVNVITLYHNDTGTPTVFATVKWINQYWGID